MGRKFRVAAATMSRSLSAGAMRCRVGEDFDCMGGTCDIRLMLIRLHIVV